jgi:hypothetical protein
VSECTACPLGRYSQLPASTCIDCALCRGWCSNGICV